MALVEGQSFSLPMPADFGGKEWLYRKNGEELEFLAVIAYRTDKLWLEERHALSAKTIWKLLQGTGARLGIDIFTERWLVTFSYQGRLCIWDMVQPDLNPLVPHFSRQLSTAGTGDFYMLRMSCFNNCVALAATLNDRSFPHPRVVVIASDVISHVSTGLRTTFVTVQLPSDLSESINQQDFKTVTYQSKAPRLICGLGSGPTGSLAALAWSDYLDIVDYETENRLHIILPEASDNDLVRHLFVFFFSIDNAGLSPNILTSFTVQPDLVCQVLP